MKTIFDGGIRRSHPFEQAEDARDLALAMDRIEKYKASEVVPLEEVEEEYDFKLEDIEPIDIDEIS